MDIWIAPALIISGGGGLLMGPAIDFFLRKQRLCSRDASVLEAIRARFQNRERFSWLMVAVGLMWTLQELFI